MFFLRHPSPDDIERFIRESHNLPFSYDPVGLARQGRAGFDVDEQIVTVGSGEAAFVRGRTALAEWIHFDLGWVEVFPRRSSIAQGSVVGVLISHLGFWSLNGCRVVYSFGADGDDEFGFAYGTLTNHAEMGEEIFSVRIHPETGDVSYIIRAASKPRATLAKLGYPVVRSLQARFRRDSARALARAIAG
jgi:uncharacterized protein (UPF0548 family)